MGERETEVSVINLEALGSIPRGASSTCSPHIYFFARRAIFFAHCAAPAEHAHRYEITCTPPRSRSDARGAHARAGRGPCSGQNVMWARRASALILPGALFVTPAALPPVSRALAAPRACPHSRPARTRIRIWGDAARTTKTAIWYHSSSRREILGFDRPS